MVRLDLLVAFFAGACLAVAVLQLRTRRQRSRLAELRRGLLEMRSTRSSELAFATRWHVPEIDGVADALDEVLKRVRSAVERERRFVGDASHELRTPITLIRGQLELLGTEPDPDERERMLRSAQRACDLLVRTTESLLALARNEASLSEAVDVSDVVIDVRDAQAAIAEDANVRRLVIDAQAPALVRGDPHLLRLAVNNVVENALKYSAGPVTVRVAVTNESSPDGVGTCVTWIVEDEGPGIPESDIAWLLQPFARGATGQQGTGLGLALVDHVARVHGGALTLSGSAAGGLKATVTLPAWRPCAS